MTVSYTHLDVYKRQSQARSDLGSAAVNEQFDPRDEARVIRCEKQCHLGNFLGLFHAPHRDSGHNPPNHVGGLPADQRRIDWTLSLRAPQVGFSRRMATIMVSSWAGSLLA